MVYAKKYPDGTTLYVEEVRSGKKELAAVTMRKMKGGIPNDLLPVFETSENPNARSDSAIPPSAGSIQQGKRDVKTWLQNNRKIPGPGIIRPISPIRPIRPITPMNRLISPTRLTCRTLNIRWCVIRDC